MRHVGRRGGTGRFVRIASAGLLGLVLGALVAPTAAAVAPSPAVTIQPVTIEQVPDEPVPDEPVVVEVFWGDGCPYCEDLLDALDRLADDLSGFVVDDYEVWYDEDGRDLMFARAAELGVDVQAVPFTVIGEESWVGYSTQIERQIEAAIVGRLPGAPPTEVADDGTRIDVPLVGDVDVAGRSLLLTTVLIAFVDGFNPCSLWVLTVLLALVLHTGSRRRVALIGGTFLLVTTAIYGLFIVGVYSALSFVGALGWIRGVVALFALTFGLINVKDFFWFKVGPSMTISDEHKPGIYRQARALGRPGAALPAVMAGAAVMAAGVALVEIPCTAGFPVIWSDLVATADTSTATFALLLGVYLLVYLFDELLVFGAAVVTMRATKLQERHGRVLKLIGGMVMITIAVTILFAPDMMNTIGGVLLVFLISIAASGAVALADHVFRSRRGVTS